MLKIVFLIVAAGNRGKSKILQKVLDLILAEFNVTIIEQILGKETFIILKVELNGIITTIGIESRSDPGFHLFQTTATRFVEMELDFILTCCRAPDRNIDPQYSVLGIADWFPGYAVYNCNLMYHTNTKGSLRKIDKTETNFEELRQKQIDEEAQYMFDCLTTQILRKSYPKPKPQTIEDVIATCSNFSL